jgi:CheY-like chemotaxis protein
MNQTKCILIVDDDQTTILLTQLFLESMSLNDVHASSNGQEAIDFIVSHCNDEGKAECPDLVLLDLNMPVMDGFEFLDEFEQISCKHKDKISVVVVSSSDSKRDRERIKNYDVAGYIVKPLTEEKLKPFL